MNFVKEIRGANVSFNVDNQKEKVLVEITLPAYGHYLRGAYYHILELSEIILEKLNNKKLIPLSKDGIVHAQKTNSVKINLEFKNKKQPETTKKSYKNTTTSQKN